MLDAMLHNKINDLDEKIKDIIIEVSDGYKEEVRKLQLDNIGIQFKYDIALNIVGNGYGRYFIDVLQDTSNIEEMVGVKFNTSTENLEYGGV